MTVHMHTITITILKRPGRLNQARVVCGCGRLDRIAPARQAEAIRRRHLRHPEGKHS